MKIIIDHLERQVDFLDAGEKLMVVTLLVATRMATKNFLSSRVCKFSLAVTKLEANKIPSWPRACRKMKNYCSGEVKKLLVVISRRLPFLATPARKEEKLLATSAKKEGKLLVTTVRTFFSCDLAKRKNN